MRRLILALLIWPGGAQADTWQVLDGPAIEQALSARVLGYDGGAMQNFFSDGRTLYEAGAGESWGRWRVDGNQYCSVWPPSESWACYGVEALDGGLDIRFVAKDGALTVGRYNDL